METQPSTTVVTLSEHLRLRRSMYGYVAVACIIALAALFYALWAKFHKEKAEAAYSITKANLDSISVKAIHFMNKDSLDVAENISLKAQNEGSIRTLSDQVFNLNDRQQKLIKSVNYYAQLKQRVDVRMVKIPFDSGQHIPLIAAGRSDSIGVPQHFSIEDTTKRIAGIVTKHGVQLDSLTIPNELFLRNITIKKGFLNMGREDRVQAFNSSHYLSNGGIVDMRWKPRPSRWNRWIKPLGTFIAGAAGMYYIRK